MYMNEKFNVHYVIDGTHKNVLFDLQEGNKQFTAVSMTDWLSSDVLIVGISRLKNV